MKKTIFTTLFISLLVTSQAQYVEPKSTFDKHVSAKAGYASAGLGLGLAYGAIGGRLGFNIMNHLNIFMGIGTNLAGLGYNFGIRTPLNTKSDTEFYFLGMYGANASSIVEGAPEYKGVYTGVTLGIGLKINTKNEGNYWDIGLLLPFRSSEYDQVIEDIANDPRVEGFVEPWPILINVGFNFKISNN